ncbi:hypothetical protein GOC31_30860 [Sinorhizobium meliloti]|nr:hypothetical protein [Sinorhizobium meliloti]MDX0253015.1 hypothetical protein [Sinorhizobium meliloti]
MVENPVSRWSDLFEQACRIIEQANSELTMIDSWTFGGGTALMPQLEAARQAAGEAIGVFYDPRQNAEHAANLQRSHRSALRLIAARRAVACI